jgi:membrane fusion protein (multidrug efflux system)
MKAEDATKDRDIPMSEIESGLEPDKPQRKATPFFRRPVVVLIIALLAVTGILYGASIFLHSMTHESTDDAFIDGHVISIAPKVSGKVIAVHVDDNQQVRKGDLLFEIDPRDFDAIAAQKRAALVVALARRKTADTSAEQAEAHMRTLAAVAESVQATVNASRANATKLESDLRRNRQMITTGVISKQELEHSTTDVASAEADVESKSKQLEAASAYNTEAEKQTDVAHTQVDAASAEVGEAKATLAQAELQLSYTRVIAPEDGRVTSKSVEPGNYVQVGQMLLAIVPNEVWVTANFKETQLADMQPGQPALISVDAYPSRDLRAHVDSVQAGSGARFSLLPPENATGNFVKVVQRVPVKIVFDEKPETQRVLGPGMSAVPNVKVKDSLVPAIIVGVIACLAIIGVLIGAGFLLTNNRNG